MAQAGNSNTITRNYLDSLLIETRYMNSTNPDTTFTLYGETFASPIMTAALSHLAQIAEGGMAEGIARGALDAGAVSCGTAPRRKRRSRCWQTQEYA